MDEQKVKKRGCILKAIFIILLIFIIIFVTLFLFYLFTKEDEKKYIPADYVGYIKIDSLADAYNNLIDLKAADIILAQPNLKKFYKILLDIRNSNLAKNKIVTSLLNMKVNIIINDEYSSVFLVDLGIKSLFLRIGQLNPDFITELFGKQKYFSIKRIINKNIKNKIFQLSIKQNNTSLYFSICNNLLFLGFNLNDIERLYDANITKNNIANDKKFYALKYHIKPRSMAEIYYNTDKIVNPVLNTIPETRKMASKINFEKNSTISFNISNENISLNTFTYCISKDEKINKILTSDINRLEIIQYLPVDINLCTVASFKSFEEFYKLFLYIEEGEFDNQINKLDNMCKVLFQNGINDLLFDWIGTEIGVFTTNVSSMPVIFVKIKDKNKLNSVIKTLINSIVFEKEKDIIYDDVKLQKIKFPEYIQNIIYSFTKQYINAPYYTIIKDYIFLSMDPAGLSNLERKYDHNLTLGSDKTFKEIYSNIGNKSNMFLYFNSTHGKPKFLYANNLISNLYSLYEKGVLSVNIANSTLKIDMSARGQNVKKVTLYPGYPVKIESMVSSPIICINASGSSLDEIIFTTKNDKFIIMDNNGNILNDEGQKMDGDNKDSPIINDLDNDGQKEIYIFTENGLLYKFDKSGNVAESYPIKTEFKGSFPPVIYKDKFVFFSNSKKKLYFYKDNNLEEFNFEFKQPLLTAPSINGNYFAFYPKNNEGTIYLTDNRGEIISGWPQNAGSIGYGSPAIDELSIIGEKQIIFITQNGNLNIYNLNGNEERNFPIKLDGVYYNQPAIGDVLGGEEKEIVCLNSNGTITIISYNGEIILKKDIKEAGSKENKLLLFDMNKNGKKEILIYGNSNNILALNSKLNLLEGFPVKGYTKPEFSDFNSDGEYEMVVGGIDNNIYVYSIPR